MAVAAITAGIMDGGTTALTDTSNTAHLVKEGQKLTKYQSRVLSAQYGALTQLYKKHGESAVDEFAKSKNFTAEAIEALKKATPNDNGAISAEYTDTKTGKQELVGLSAGDYRRFQKAVKQDAKESAKIVEAGITLAKIQDKIGAQKFEEAFRLYDQTGQSIMEEIDSLMNFFQDNTYTADERAVIDQYMMVKNEAGNDRIDYIPYSGVRMTNAHKRFATVMKKLFGVTVVFGKYSITNDVTANRHSKYEVRTTNAGTRYVFVDASMFDAADNIENLNDFLTTEVLSNLSEKDRTLVSDFFKNNEDGFADW